MKQNELLAPDRSPSSSQKPCGRKSFFHPRILLRRLGSDSGSSLVEFTVSVPVLFMLLLGFAQMCIAVYSNFCITELARDTARWASVRGSNSCADAAGLTDCDATAAEIQTVAQSAVYPGVDASKITVSSEWLQASSTTPATWSECTSSKSSICNAPGNAVKVSLSYPFPIQIPFISSNTLSLHSTSQLVIVQ